MFRKMSVRPDLDMTNGPLLIKIVRFTLPLILTGVLQLLYNAADIVVVGRFSGAEGPQALAAVGSTSSLINLIVNIFMGLSVGGSVVVAKSWGARDHKSVSQAVHTAITLAGVGGVVLMVVGVFFSGTFLTWMGTPLDVLPGATLYMQIYFAGMPFNLLYTFSAAILRAVGDTKRPLYFLTLAGLVNVGLNLVFVVVFHMSVAGVALATISSQAISMVLALRCLMKADTSIRLMPKELRIYRRPLMQILQVGLPAGVQGSLFSISNVLIQSAVNSFESIAMAGNAAASNLEGFVYTAMNAVHQADITFASQNMGAGKPRRVKRILWLCLGLVTFIGLLTGGVLYLFGEPLLSIYNGDPQVIAFGLRRMAIICLTYFTCGWMDVMVGQMRGIGCSLLPMVVSLTGACLFRVVWIYTIFAANHTPECLFISYPISWVLTSSVHLISYFIVRKKLLPQEALGQ